MPYPKPEVGLVISYSYRPCAIVVAQIEEEGKPPRVVVEPVTHSRPPDPRRALEIPPGVTRHLGLYEEQSCVVLNEFNVFTWPGFDLRPIPRTDRYVYGFLPPKYFEQIRQKFLELVKAGVAEETWRDDQTG